MSLTAPKLRSANEGEGGKGGEGVRRRIKRERAGKNKEKIDERKEMGGAKMGSTAYLLEIFSRKYG